VLAVLVLVGGTARAADPLREVRSLSERFQYAKALTTALAAAHSAEETTERRFRAFLLAADVYEAIGCRSLAIATCERAVVVLGARPDFVAKAACHIAHVRREVGEFHEAASVLESAVATQGFAGLPLERQVETLHLLARSRRESGRPGAALAVYRQIAALTDEPAPIAVPLANAARLHAELGQPAEALACLERLGNDPGDDEAAAAVGGAYVRIVKHLLRAGRKDEALGLAAKAARFLASRPEFPRDVVLAVIAASDDAAALDLALGMPASTLGSLRWDHYRDALLAAARRTDRVEDVAALCMRAAVAQPFEQSLTLDCLRTVVAIRLGQDRCDDAVAAACAAYAVEYYRHYSSSARSRSKALRYRSHAARLVVAALRARDGHLASGNLFLNRQVYGPAGPDRREGTDDDLADPLAGVAFSPDPRIDALFEAALDAQPDTTAGHRTRGWVYLLWCKPRQALGQFKQAFAKCSLDPSALAQAVDDVERGLRALHGTAVGIDAFARYQNYGPNGPDQRPGTADDLKDPLAGF
jgi:tetratricopeptide (TPR) repeat protein